ncbi:MAG: hypothetical protein H0Z54_02875 [Nitrospira sp.]|nr:hypothetical protein [Nitrospira sp.]
MRKVYSFLLAVGCAVFVVSSAMAESSELRSSAFEGFYGQVGTGYEQNRFSSLSHSWVNTTDNFKGRGAADGQKASGMPLSMGVGYFHRLHEAYLLGVGVDYAPLVQQTAKFDTASTNDNNFSFKFRDASYKTSHRVNAYLMPAYAFDADKLGYVKIGYSVQSLQHAQPSDLLIRLDKGYSTAKVIHGYVVGVGYKQIMTRGIYGFVEGNYTAYGKQTLHGTGFASGNPIAFSASNLGVSAYNVLVGLGYTFSLPGGS